MTHTHQVRWRDLSLLYFDCFSGASGDMVMGALIDAGVPLDAVKDALGGLAIDRESVWTERVRRAGVTATRFCVRGERVSDEPLAAAHPHPHTQAAGVGQTLRAGHRSLAEIGALIETSALSTPAKDRATALFDRLGQAEAAIHGTSMEDVHLHEVGALDSVIDIVGAVFALEYLGVDRVVSSPLNVGSGTVASAHGTYPVPAPATLRLLEGVPVYAGPEGKELVTPTGALLISSYAASYGTMPAMTVRKVGYGAGARDFSDRPNVLRVTIGDEDRAGQHDVVTVIEAEIDDMNPQIFGVVMERLLAEGALDVFYTPIQMKKNRPGTLMSVVCRPPDRQAHTAIIFRETTTIGVRYREMNRECLDRETVHVTTPYGRVGVKMARRNGELLNAAPEFEDCARLARESGQAVKDVQAAAMKAFLDEPVR